MAKSEFLMQLYKYVPHRYSVAGWFLSEKLDGQRCYWDGGVTRGMPKADVPWANMDKDERLLVPQIATGLWSRYGNVVHAPDYWLNTLPAVPLDGELYIGHNTRQTLMKTIKPITPDEYAWESVKYNVYDSPSYHKVFANRKISLTSFKKTFSGILQWLDDQDADVYWPKDERFEDTLKRLKATVLGKFAVLHTQMQLDWSTMIAREQVNRLLAITARLGGEGLVLRHPDSHWIPERSKQILKLKKLDDAEGLVIGCTAGRETALGSKLLGKMGALILQLKNGRVLELSGFTDDERLLTEAGRVHATANPGETMPIGLMPVRFPLGKMVTFQYRGLTDDGIPMEARYWRDKIDE